jgi:hypothetical protein
MHTIETREIINASPRRVWDVLSDLERFGE